jgi:hypothetical protein
MRITKAIVFVMVMTTTLAASSLPSIAAWPIAVENRCWKADGFPTSALTIRIEPKGSGFYEVMGKLMTDRVLKNIFTGTVVKNGTSFVMHASQTGSDQPGSDPKDILGGLMKCTFSQSTLAAECEEISFVGNDSSGITTEFHTHRLTPIRCK